MCGRETHGRMSGASGETNLKIVPWVGRSLERLDLELIFENHLYKLADLTENASWSAT